MLLYQMQASTLPFLCKDSHWNAPRLEKPQETGSNKPYPAVAQSAGMLQRWEDLLFLNWFNFLYRCGGGFVVSVLLTYISFLLPQTPFF